MARAAIIIHAVVTTSKILVYDQVVHVRKLIPKERLFYGIF